MSKDWDTFKTLNHFQDFIAEVFTEAIRVLKPGGHALVWAIPRTSHHTAMGLERAGFEIRDVVNHIFASGFPKSLNIGKQVMKIKGDEGVVVGEETIDVGMQSGNMHAGRKSVREVREATDPDAIEWEGWGTALKPATEHWILCRKPILEKTIAENVLKFGTGGINIDGCRIEGEPPHHNYGRTSGEKSFIGKGEVSVTPQSGRFPANIIFSHSDECKLIGTTKEKTPTGSGHLMYKNNQFNPATGENKNNKPPTNNSEISTDVYECVDGCPVKELNKQSGVKKSGLMKAGTPRQMSSNPNVNTYGHFDSDTVLNDTYGDIGGASRFFFTPKPSGKERNLGTKNLPIAEENLQGLDTRGRTLEREDGSKTLVERWIPNPRSNHHPTVKPVALMSYLIKLITPKGGIVLDMFGGSGTTGIAAKINGFKFILIETDQTNCDIAVARIKTYVYQERLF